MVGTVVSTGMDGSGEYANVVQAPPGPLGLTFGRVDHEAGAPTYITSVAMESSVAGLIADGAVLLEVDGIDIGPLSPVEIANFLVERASSTRTLKVVNPTKEVPTVEKVFAVSLDGLVAGRIALARDSADTLVVTDVATSSPLLGRLPVGAVMSAVNGKSCFAADAPLGFVSVVKTPGAKFGISLANGRRESPGTLLQVCSSTGLVQEAGLKEGDVIVSIFASSGKEADLASPTTATAFLQSINNVTTVTFTYVRGGATVLALTCMVPHDFVPSRLAYVPFVPIKSPKWETLAQMIGRMNAFVSATDLKVTSVETASVDGSIDRIKETRYISGGSDRSEHVYQTLRVWYNALDPSNTRPRVLRGIREQERETAEHIKTAEADCVVM